MLSVLCFCLEENIGMETKKLFIMLFIGGIAALMSVSAYAMFGEKLEGALPVMNTLSSEQLAGVGYTSMTAADDSDMWDDDGDYVRMTAVPETSTEFTVSFPLDINTASAEELMQINGIGKVTAESIVAYRDSFGYFYSVEELLNVDGIGEKKLAGMTDFIYIDPDIIPRTEIEEAAALETGSGSDISDTEDMVTVTVSAGELTDIFPLELNTASMEELMSINGIGEVIARNIVEYAEQYGFNDVDDLLNVSGIGESKLKSIAPYVYVDIGER